MDGWRDGYGTGEDWELIAGDKVMYFTITALMANAKWRLR